MIVKYNFKILNKFINLYIETVLFFYRLEIFCYKNSKEIR